MYLSFLSHILFRYINSPFSHYSIQLPLQQQPRNKASSSTKVNKSGGSVCPLLVQSYQSKQSVTLCPIKWSESTGYSISPNISSVCLLRPDIAWYTVHTLYQDHRDIKKLSLYPHYQYIKYKYQWFINISNSILTSGVS